MHADGESDLSDGGTPTVKCPNCGSEKTIPIFYGYPTPDSMEALLAAVGRGEIELGGCNLMGNDPTHHCTNCGRYFGRLKP